MSIRLLRRFINLRPRSSAFHALTTKFCEICGLALMIFAVGCGSPLAVANGMEAQTKLDLRVFDGRASSFLARMEEAGMPVYRLTDVAEIRVPPLAGVTDPRTALEQVAAASDLHLEWVENKPLLCYLSPPGQKRVLQDKDDVDTIGWSGSKQDVAAILAFSRKADPPLKRACAEAVLRFGRAAGAALLDREAAEDLVRFALTDDNWLLRRQAVLAAVDLGLDNAAAMVEKAAMDKHSEVVRAAALAAGRLGGEKGAAILEKLLNPEHVDRRFRRDVRFAVTYGCAELGTDKAVELLDKLVEGKDAYLAVWALRAAGLVGNDRALALLKEAAADSDPRRKRGAAIGLGHCRAEGAVETLAPLAMFSPPREGMWVQPQNAAAVALGRHGTKEAVKILIEAWDKPADSPRLGILYALGLAGTPAALDFLETQRKNPDERLQQAASWALDKKNGMEGGPVKADGVEVEVLPGRPRLWLRAGNRDGYEGPSLVKIRRNFRRPDYRRAAKMDKLPRDRMGQLVLWLVSGDEFAGMDAAAWACEMQDKGIARARGRTPSYWGISVQRTAAAYDWLHGHGDVDPVTRRMIMHHLEDWALNAYEWVEKKHSTVFYSRRWGALAGCGVAGLALYGDSPLADKCVELAAWHMTAADGLGSIRQAQDGVTAGSCYGLHHMFTDNANLVAALTYATDLDVASIIREQRGDWLRKQLYFQMHCTYPDGTFLKDGDMWSGASERSQYRMQVDVVTGLYQDGFGRTWADRMAARWPAYYPSDYHTKYVWQFFVFNDPDVKGRPLAEMPRCMLFSPKLDGYVLWRSGWGKDDTVVHFHCGDSLDMHGGYDQGKFVIFKHKPLANKNGIYKHFGSPLHKYYRSALSANVVIFDSPVRRGKGRTTEQIGYQNKAGGVNSFDEFKKVRASFGPPVGKIVKHEVTKNYARAVGVLDGSTQDKGKENKWTREMVFLDYQYVVVLDRVRTGPQSSAKWLLNFEKEPRVESDVIRFDNEPGRLFCRTLLPENPAFKKVGGNDAPEVMRHQWRVEVSGPDPGAADQVFLHVLFPAETTTKAMPKCEVRKKGAEYVVTVGGQTISVGAE